MNGDTGTASHSASEIKAAYDAGKLIMMKADETLIKFDMYIFNIAIFADRHEGSFDNFVGRYYSIDNNKNITIDTYTSYFIPEPTADTDGMILQSTPNDQLRKAKWVSAETIMSAAIASAIGGSY